MSKEIRIINVDDFDEENEDICCSLHSLLEEGFLKDKTMACLGHKNSRQGLKDIEEINVDKVLKVG